MVPRCQSATGVVLCGLVLLAVSTCRPQLSSEEARLRTSRWARHREVVRRFPCGPPQPRSISVKELIGDQLETSEKAEPHVTVLHRCDSGTGCCEKSTEVCSLAEKEEVPLHFHITDSIRKKFGFREFMVDNHTLCSCQTNTNVIK